ncbi:MAG: MBL fold metallo-hydrolase [Actinomycetota bacterium]
MNDVVRMHMGEVIAPNEHRLAGLITFVEAYVIPHPAGIILFDTGIGYDPEVDAHYRITRTPLFEALSNAGFKPDDVRFIVNCHLHFDHSGENFRFPGVPIFAQRLEVEATRGEEYTLPDVCVNFDGAAFEELTGEADIANGVRIIPTPGHTEGHQSLLVETKEGRLMFAGQTFDSAYAFAENWNKPERPAWMDEIEKLDVQRALFAHDIPWWIKPSSEEKPNPSRA